MKHYLYECTDQDSECEGEEFLVGANDRNEARRGANANEKRLKSSLKCIPDDGVNLSTQ